MKASILRMVSGLSLFCCCLTASSCTKSGTGTNDNTFTPGDTASTHDNAGKSFLALGDSYTIGESVNASDRFPAQTIALLKTKGFSVGAPQYIARTGWTTADLQDAIKSTSLLSSYDIVTLLIGVNDQYQGMDSGGYRVRFTQLLQKAVSLAGGNKNHVFVVSIPDYSVTPFGGGSAKIKTEIAAFNAINKQVTDGYGISYTDITPTSQRAATDQSYTAGDGLHPSAVQYAEWAKLLSANIYAAF